MGTRLWPASRKLHPKQFLPLLGDESLLQRTVQRLDGLDHATPLVICNEEHRFLAAELLAAAQWLRRQSWGRVVEDEAVRR